MHFVFTTYCDLENKVKVIKSVVETISLDTIYPNIESFGHIHFARLSAQVVMTNVLYFSTPHDLESKVKVTTPRDLESKFKITKT